jgi:hypothetical protein
MSRRKIEFYKNIMLALLFAATLISLFGSANPSLEIALSAFPP